MTSHPARTCAFICILSLVCAATVLAQPGVLPQTGSSTNITPVVTVAPAVFAAGQPAEAYLTITNGNPTSSKQIQAGDAFTITLESALGSGFLFTTPPLVNSATLAPSDFSVSPSVNQVVITYTTATAKVFAPGENISLKVSFTASATLKAYKVTWQGPYVKGASNGRFNELVARYTTVQVAAATAGGGGTITGVTAGTGLTGGGTSGNVNVGIANGGVGTTQLADDSVTVPKIAAGQVVKSLNGLTDSITLAAGSNVTLTPSGNTLTIAATAGTAGSGTAGAIAKWVSGTTLGNSAITENSGTGNIGIGAAPLGSVKLAVTGNNTLAGIYGKTTDSSFGVQGDSVSGPGVIGISLSGPGLSGNSGSSRGVIGQSTSDVGVLGLSDPNGLGITAPSGTGVLGAGVSNGIVGYSATGLAGNFLGRIFVDSTTSNSTANNVKAVEVARTGSFNTTGGVLTGYSGYFSNTATRSTGSNNLINVGLFATASGAQNNYAAIFDQGNVGIGTSAPSERLQVAGVIHSTTGGIRFPDGSLQTTAAAGGGSGGVSNVTASAPLTSSGGATPNISLTGVVPIANGGTGSATQNFVDLSSDQDVGGNKSFTGAINTNAEYKLNGARFLSATSDNLFMGAEAGQATALYGGAANTFLGISAGRANGNGTSNSFVGYLAGYSNFGGNSNSFTGAQAGYFNTNGSNNSFLGSNAGVSNTTGSSNTFIGASAGTTITTTSNNTFIGAGADGVTGLTNATALGFKAKVTQSNSLVLGSINGVNGATANTNVGIGVTAPTERLQVAGVVHSTTGGIKFPDGSVQLSAASGGVTSVTATAPLTSTGGTTPTISLGVVPIANGGTGSNTQNFVDLATTQNIGGAKTFTAAINTTAQYNLNGFTVLSAPGTANLFAGFSAGAANTSGSFNSIFGTSAGVVNTTGSRNSFFGYLAGNNNSDGFYNSFLGMSAGQSNTTGGRNAFIGYQTGFRNLTGQHNAFVGNEAGYSNTNSDNSFFGSEAGYWNNTGQGNTFIGRSAGVGSNTFYANASGSFNTYLGYLAYGNGDTTNNLTNATAIGARAQVNCSDCLVLGSIAGANGATLSTKVGIGTTSPSARLHVVAEDEGVRAIGYIGVYGRSTLNGIGVKGESGSNYGVHASGYIGLHSEGTYRAGEFVGDVRINNGCLYVNDTAVGPCSSDARLKKDVNNLGYGLRAIGQLRPVIWHWKNKPEAKPELYVKHTKMSGLSYPVCGNS